MSIKKYTNFEKINLKLENEGKFIQEKDNFIISQDQIESSDFGECEYDVMEVSVYDINNNLLPQSSGNTVAYIKSGDIKNYLYTMSVPNLALPDGKAKRELAIDVEKLLNDLGFTNGILRINVNFVRNKLGDENEFRKAYIQQISATKNEIRILPLKTFDRITNKVNEKEFNNLSNLSKDFKWYKKEILDTLHSFDNLFLNTINSYIQSKYGNDFFVVLRKDFGLSNFDDFTKRIYNDFTKSVEYYLGNKYYDITQTNFGIRLIEKRFEDCERYDFNLIIGEIQNILFKCIDHNSYFLKRRDFLVSETPKEFVEPELPKLIQEIQSIVTPPIKEVNIVYNPQTADVQPKEPTPIVVQQPPVQPTIIPDEIPVFTTGAHYMYSVKNTSSSKTFIFKFTDAVGSTVQKTIAPGITTNICAKEGSISPSSPTNLSADDSTPADFKTGNADNPVYWSITKMNLCNTLDIGSNSPVQLINTKPTDNPVRQTTVGAPTMVSPQPAPINTGCFVEGTMVTLANGTKLVIEEITIGMEVLTWNENTNKKEVGIVENLIRPISSNIISIEYGDEMIECTAEHPFFVIGKGWASYDPTQTEIHHRIQVNKLEEGDLLLNSNDETISINSITPINVLVPIQTYNLSIEGNHTYYANDVLVHNKLSSNTAASNTVSTIGNDNLTTSNVTTLQINTMNTSGMSGV